MSVWLCCVGFAWTAAFGAAEVQTVPIARISLLRLGSAWVLLDGKVKFTDGAASVSVPPGSDWAVEVVDGGATAAVESSKTPHTLQVKLQKPADEARLRITGMLSAVGWVPQYRLELGKDSRLRLDALITNTLTIPLASTEVDCAVAVQLANGMRDPAGSDPTFYPVAEKQLPAGGTLHATLLSEAAPSEEFVSVQLAGFVNHTGAPQKADVATAMLRVTNQTTRMWPPGRLTVLEAGRFRAVVDMPQTEPGAAAEIRLGPATGVSVVREEVELERKMSPIRRENEAPDRIQTAGTVTINNRRSRATRVRLSKQFVGEGVSASDDGRILRLANVLGTDQPASEIRWNLLVPAGETRKLTFGTMLQIVVPESKDK